MRIVLILLAVIFLIGGLTSARVAPSLVFGFSALFLVLFGILNELVSIRKIIAQNSKELTEQKKQINE